jgi:lipid-A-disaccharide synthase-like uncharacterized protein
MEPDVLLLFSIKYSIGFCPEAVETTLHPIPLSSILILSQVVTTSYFLTKDVYVFIIFYTCYSTCQSQLPCFIILITFGQKR